MLFRHAALSDSGGKCTEHSVCIFQLAPALDTACCRLMFLCCVPAVVSSVSLAAELDLLLHLIALPPGISCKSSPDALHQQLPRFSTGAIAALYAAQVLSLSGGPHCSMLSTYFLKWNPSELVTDVQSAWR